MCLTSRYVVLKFFLGATRQHWKFCGEVFLWTILPKSSTLELKKFEKCIVAAPPSHACQQLPI